MDQNVPKFDLVAEHRNNFTTPPTTTKTIATFVQHAFEDILNNFTHLHATNKSMEFSSNSSAPETVQHQITSLLSNITNAALNAAASTVSKANSNVDIPATADDVLLEHAPQLTASSLVKVYVLMTMAVISLVGNVATMWNIYKTRLARRGNRHSWSAIYTLIFHLSIADLIVTGFCIVGEAMWYYTVQWMAGDQICKLVKLFQMFGLYLSTYVLVLIGIDRWIAVKYPMKSLNMAKRCYRLLGGIYVFSFVLSVPQYFIFRVKKGPFIEDFHQCVTHGFYEYDWQEQLYTTFTMVFMFLLPLIILFGSYLSTFRTISDSEQMFQGSKLAIYPNKPSMRTNRQRLIHKAKMKSLRISVVIIFAFLICWTPYNVMMIIFIFLNPDKNFSEDLQKGIFFFGMANSLVNPLIYGAFHLCPTNRKAKKNACNNNKYSLTRGDSQRTASMLTAVTQVDSNHRSSRSFRQASYVRSFSNGIHKEHVALLPSSVCLTSLRNHHQAPINNQHHQLQGSITADSSRKGSFCILSTSNGVKTIATKTSNGQSTNPSIKTTDNSNGFIDPNEHISIV